MMRASLLLALVVMVTAAAGLVDESRLRPVPVPRAERGYREHHRRNREHHGMRGREHRRRGMSWEEREESDSRREDHGHLREHHGMDGPRGRRGPAGMSQEDLMRLHRRWEHRPSDGRRRPRPREPVRPAGAGFRRHMSNLRSAFESALEPLRSLREGRFSLGPFNVDWNLDSLSREEPWYDGPNVCVEREEKEEEAGEIATHLVTTATSCDNSGSVYTCTADMNVYGKKKTVTVTYKCCYGYEREEGKSGCTKELELLGLVETAEDLDLWRLLEAAESVRLADALASGNFTVFAPPDEALEHLEQLEMPEPNVVLVSPESVDVAKEIRAMLASHLVPGFLASSGLRDEQLLDTFYPHASIRLNFYNSPVKLMTANCVPVTSRDHLATNGIIHVTERLLPTVSQSLLEVIGADPELSTFAEVLQRTGLADMLRQPGQLTVFAPTDAAFQRLSPDVRDYILQANTCLMNTVKAHIVKHVICSAVVQAPGRTHNLLGELLSLNVSDGRLAVDGAEVVARDVMGTNGVLHVIDDVIVPEKALGILERARQAGVSSVLELIEKAGLDKTLRELDNFTIFLPTDDAIEALPAAVRRRMVEDRDYLAAVLRYHVVEGRELSAVQLFNDLHLSSLHGDDDVHVKEYSSFPFSVESVKTVQCAPLVKTNLQSCNAMGHLVDKVLLPPSGDVLDVLSRDGRFGRLLALLKEADISEKLQLGGPYTFFAPTDQAFDSVDQELLNDLRRNKRKLAGFLAHHLTHDTLCCAGMSLNNGLQWWWSPKELTLDPGSHVVLQRNRDNSLLVDDTPVVTCDLTATNGVVHAIDDLLPSAAYKFGLKLRPSHRIWPHLGRGEEDESDESDESDEDDEDEDRWMSRILDRTWREVLGVFDDHGLGR